MLPDINGYEVCKALKARTETSLIPVVMVTARVAAENRQRASRRGDDYVPKPYTPDQIFDAMTAADAWTREIEGHADVGEIVIDTRDDVEPFAEIGRLQSLLLLRTSWDEESVRQFHADVVAMTQSLLDWGRKRGTQGVAKIRYDLSTDRVALDVEDGSGCFGAEDLPNDQALGRLIGQGRFDEVQFSEAGDQVHLSRSSVRQGELPISLTASSRGLGIRGPRLTIESRARWTCANPGLKFESRSGDNRPDTWVAAAALGGAGLSAASKALTTSDRALLQAWKGWGSLENARLWDRFSPEWRGRLEPIAEAGLSPARIATRCGNRCVASILPRPDPTSLESTRAGRSAPSGRDPRRPSGRDCALAAAAARGRPVRALLVR